MKRKLSLLFLSMMALFFITSCSDDDDDYNPHYNPDAAVLSTFKQMFPNATKTTWGEKNDYAVADFLNDKKTTTAWFSKTGTWYLTETDIAVSALPKAITDAIANNSKYASLTPSSASMLERSGMTSAYLVELTGGDDVLDLYYTADGYLFDEIDKDGIGNKAEPTPVKQPISAMVSQNYKGAQIVYIDKDNDEYDVTLLENGTYFIYILSDDYKWIQTEYAQSFANVPQVVKDGLKRDGYAFNDLYDTVTRLIRPQGANQITIYRFEMNNSTGHVTVYYDANGNKLDE